MEFELYYENIIGENLNACFDFETYINRPLSLLCSEEPEEPEKTEEHKDTEIDGPREQDQDQPPEEQQQQQQQQQQQPEVPAFDYHKPIAKELFALPCGFSFQECAICFEPIEMINVSVTTCGHTFHSSCIFTALDTNDGCPLCRHLLIPREEPEYEDEDEDDDDDDSDNNSDDETDEEQADEDAPKLSLEQLLEKLSAKGYSPTDIIRFFIKEVKSENTNLETKYTEEYFEKMEESIIGLMEGVDENETPQEPQPQPQPQQDPADLPAYQQVTA